MFKVFLQPLYYYLGAMGYGLDDRRFESRQGLGIFLFTTASRPALRPTQPPIQCTSGALSLRLKRLRHEADQSPPHRTRMRGAIPSLPLYVFMAWCLVKHRDNFTFTIILLFVSINLCSVTVSFKYEYFRNTNSVRSFCAVDV
jgi:hypothetical protein